MNMPELYLLEDRILVELMEEKSTIVMPDSYDHFPKIGKVIGKGPDSKTVNGTYVMIDNGIPTKLNEKQYLLSRDRNVLFGAHTVEELK